MITATSEVIMGGLPTVFTVEISSKYIIWKEAVVHGNQISIRYTLPDFELKDIEVRNTYAAIDTDLLKLYYNRAKEAYAQLQELYNK